MKTRIPLNIVFVALSLLALASHSFADAPSYVGSDACKACHAKIGEEFSKNPHAKTLTQAPSDEYKGCESCHGPGSLHITGPSQNKMFNPAAADDTKANDSCSKCHFSGTDSPRDWQNIDAKYWRRGEHNRSGVSCAKCHTIHGSAPKLLTKAAPEACLSCHPGVLQENGKKTGYTHAPVAGGMCTKCHDPHGTAARHNVVNDLSKICSGCHKPDVPEMASSHGGINVSDANCASCHDPHSHNKSAKLIKTNQHMPFKSHQCTTCHKASSTELIKPERELCTTCHSKDLASQPADGSRMHAAVKEGMCTGCHNPHASNAKKAYWKEETLAYACFTCHSSVEYQVNGQFPHAPLKNMDCLSCHKPHTSREPSLLVKSEEDLCKQCHKEHNLMHPMLKKPDGKPVIDPIRKSPLICTSCHTPHGGQFEHMAVRDYRRDLCTGCHNGMN